MTKRSRKLLPAIHPGEILFEEFMKPLGLSINRVARDLRVPVARIADIVHGQRGVSSDTALRLARYFSTTPAFWMNLQSAYSLEVAEREVKGQIDRDVHPLNAAAGEAVGQDGILRGGWQPPLSLDSAKLNGKSRSLRRRTLPQSCGRGPN
jgi:addiction module HigA family antidote